MGCCEVESNTSLIIITMPIVILIITITHFASSLTAILSI